MSDRVQKILSQWGIASRRQAEQMILDGRVRLNGLVVALGQCADPLVDQLEVDGQLVEPSDRPDPTYLLLNKPLNVVSTCWDPEGRATVLDFIPPVYRQGQGLHPVGRLDFESTGALLLTNDGALTFELTHPSHQVSKTYWVSLDRKPDLNALRQWREGVNLEGRLTLPAEVELLEENSDGMTLLKVVIREGRNRQIRRVAQVLGYQVMQLHRSAIGPIELDLPGQSPIREGELRPLSPTEVILLKRQVYLPSIGAKAASKESEV